MGELSSGDISIIKFSGIICLVLLGISGGLYLLAFDPNTCLVPVMAVAIVAWATAEAIGKKDMQMGNR